MDDVQRGARDGSGGEHLFQRREGTGGFARTHVAEVDERGRFSGTGGAEHGQHLGSRGGGGVLESEADAERPFGEALLEAAFHGRDLFGGGRRGGRRRRRGRRGRGWGRA